MSLLSLKDLTPNSIPSSSSSEELNSFKTSLIESSTLLISSLPSSASKSSSSTSTSTSTIAPWKKGKQFNKSLVPTEAYRCRHPPGSEETLYKWHARISDHKNNNKKSNDDEEDIFEGFKQGLLIDHSKHEQVYIESCSEAKLIESYCEGLEVWRMSYHLDFPLTNRDFVVLIHTAETTPSVSLPLEGPPPLRSFQVISIPFAHPQAPIRKGFVRGRYVSVEEVREVEEKGIKKVIWRMTTASNAGGNVPKSVTEMAMPSKIAEDVPSFMNYLKKQSKK